LHSFPTRRSSDLIRIIRKINEFSGSGPVEAPGPAESEDAMTQPQTKSLLRRTAVAIAAVAASLFTLPVSALTMSLPGGGTCTTPNIQTQPDGSLSLTCGTATGGTPTPPPTPAVYIVNTYSQLPLSASASGVDGDPPAASATIANVFIARSNASTGDITVGYNISGTGCYANGFPQPA